MDFHLEKLKELLVDIKSGGYQICPFEDYWADAHRLEAESRLVLLRHDVDRFPETALEVARVENQLGIRGTYFFRSRRHTLKSKIVRAISDLGHEIGYHYECLADAKGDHALAIKKFASDLKKIREIAPVKSASMHSRPFSPHDGRSLWDRYELSEFGLLGETYRSINHHRFLYIADSGRNWGGGRNVVWDRVDGKNVPAISGTDELRTLFRNQTLGHVQLLVHPNRWPRSLAGWFFQWSSDQAINGMKSAIKLVRARNGT